MADLNVSLILKLVDRLTGPARAASASLEAIGRIATAGAAASKSFTSATEAATGSLSAMGRVSEGASAAVSAAGRAAEIGGRSISALTASTSANSEATAAATEATRQLERGTEGSGRAAERAAERFGFLERMQMRGRAATRMLGGKFSKLNAQLGNVALASIATSGMERAGHSILSPIQRAIGSAAEFQRGMTGIGILADLPASRLGAIQSNIMASAQKLAIPIAMMQQDDMAVLNEGVYRRGADLVKASQSAARLSLLADIGGAPITGAEAGGLMATYAHSMLAPASMLDKLNATLFRASQIGGDKVGDAARFLPMIMGQMKARAFGNYQGFVDANVALQLTKRVTGNDEAAGTDVTDLMLNLNHMLTDRRFKRAGFDLEKIIADANKVGVSPMVAALDAIMSKIGTSPTDPNLAGKLGKFFMNSQAQTAALAIITNQRDTSAGPGFNTFRNMISGRQAVDSYFSATATASKGGAADLVRLQNAQQQIAISTGTILLPAISKIAGAFTRIADLVTRFQTQNGFLARAAVYAASATGVLALGAGALGNAIVGIAGPILIARRLVGRIAPLTMRAGAGRLAGAAMARGGGLAGVASRSGRLAGLWPTWPSHPGGSPTGAWRASAGPGWAPCARRRDSRSPRPARRSGASARPKPQRWTSAAAP